MKTVRTRRLSVAGVMITGGLVCLVLGLLLHWSLLALYGAFLVIGGIVIGPLPFNKSN